MMKWSNMKMECIGGGARWIDEKWDEEMRGSENVSYKICSINQSCSECPEYYFTAHIWGKVMFSVFPPRGGTPWTLLPGPFRRGKGGEERRCPVLVWPWRKGDGVPRSEPRTRYPPGRSTTGSTQLPPPDTIYHGQDKPRVVCLLRWYRRTFLWFWNFWNLLNVCCCPQTSKQHRHHSQQITWIWSDYCLKINGFKDLNHKMYFYLKF